MNVDRLEKWLKALEHKHAEAIEYILWWLDELGNH
jgi:hypothetical protein